MSDHIVVVAKTQVIVVNPASSSVSVSYTGPVGPAGPAQSTYIYEVPLSKPTDAAISTGTTIAAFRAPANINGKNLTGVAALLTTPSSSGVVTVDVNRSRRTNATTRSVVSMLSTKLTIDPNEYDSVDATAAVIDTANNDVQTGDHLLFDIDTAGVGAKGLLLELTFS